ncbi:Dehydrogenase [Planctomycetales bacterium 10988]|nr:Dehydrogenase [Planctomycetales bacterium 10988]
MENLRYQFISTIVLCSLLFPHMSWGDEFPAIYNSETSTEAVMMPAEQAAATMQVPEGFQVQLYAAEPEVQNPIAMAWDDRGRMWVAENFTYAEGTKHFELALRDRVLIFEDEDNDGKADSRKVFTDKVQMLTSVEVGRGGVWLMCPPRLLFIPDANQDDIPDGPAQVMLDGFKVGTDSYHNFANGLRWGPDGWLYGRCGHSCPGLLGTPGTPQEDRVPIEGGIWRFHPERKTVEVLCHGTVNPWGHDWDQHGELFFINTVIGHLWHMLPGSHFKESFGESTNPGVYERMDTIADHYHYDRTGSWQDSRDGAANNYGGGHAHIGMMIYQAQQWPEQYRHQLFTLNMHGRRANVERLDRDGAGYVGCHEPDFFLAEDPYFRGLEISVGPDGNVFVIDWSDTGECHERNGVHRTSGRIFKICYGKESTPQPLPKPYCLQGEGKLPTLWKQYQAGETTPEMLRSLLQDEDEHVRVWAIRLLTDFWPLDTLMGPKPNAVYPDDPDTRAELVRLAREDESGLVQLVLASTLQRLPVEHRAELARELVQHKAFAHDKDLPFLTWFGLIPVGEDFPMELVEVAQKCQWPATMKWIARNLAANIETSPEAIDALLASAESMPHELQESILFGMNEAFQGWRSAAKPSHWDRFTKQSFVENHPAIVRDLSTLFGDGLALEEIRQIALDRDADLKMRMTALQTLIDARPDDLRSICEKLLSQKMLNTVALKGLALYDDPKVAENLIKNYRRFEQTDRPSVLETLVSRPKFAKVLLDQVEAGKSQIGLEVITPFHARQIASLNDAELTKRLSEVWGELRDTPAERQAQIAMLQEQLQPNRLSQADLRAGRGLFRKTCSQCHMLYGDGSKIGPDLTGAQRSSLDYLLSNILDPSGIVSKDYRMTMLMTEDGRVINGLVVAKNQKSLTIQTPNEQQTIPLDEIEAMQETTLSPMPEGLLDKLSPEELANLFGYLMHTNQVPLPEGFE